MNINPRRDAAALADAANQLALSTRSFEDPLAPYFILGDVLETLRELHQVAVQLANWHVMYADHALHDQGNSQEGASEVAQALTLAALQIDKCWDAVNNASGISRHLIWRIPIGNQT